MSRNFTTTIIVVGLPINAINLRQCVHPVSQGLCIVSELFTNDNNQSKVMCTS